MDDLRGDEFRTKEILGAALDLAALCVFMVFFIIVMLCM